MVWHKWFVNQALRRELVITLGLKLALLVVLKNGFLPAKLTEQQAAGGVAARLVGSQAVPATLQSDTSQVLLTKEPR